MGADVRDLFERAIEEFGRRVHGVKDDRWHASTPCTDWDVRAVVNHLVYELRWAVPLFEGQTVAEVGDRFEGDLLGDDPVATWDEAARGGLAAVTAEGAMDTTVHLSFGDFPGSEYTRQLVADLLIHGWDLARGSGQDEHLDPELVAEVGEWFTGVEALYRSAGAIAERRDAPADADAQIKLLADYGRKA
jgi:uncharacterized protein (TIGR03086 family)